MSAMVWVEAIIPAAFICAELYVSKKNKWQSYDFRECLASIAIKVIMFVMAIQYTTFLGPIFAYVWKNRIFDLQCGLLLEIVLYVLANEFLFYCSHYFGHHFSIGWGNHATHHSIKKFNLISAMRVGVTGPFALYAFFPLVLVWLGFNPVVLRLYMHISFNYQLLLHTETIGKMGFLEGILNTPSAHRAHHGTQDIYLNKNLGGITVIFDRIFGTYQAELESDPPKYGIRDAVSTDNPFRLSVIGWELLLRKFLKKVDFSKPEVVKDFRLREEI